MQITRTTRTQHVGLDITRLKQFLLEQQFDPEIINELDIMLLPMSSSREALLPPSPLRTARASFPAYRSSLSNASRWTRFLND
jgi:hypothetical protein